YRQYWKLSTEDAIAKAEEPSAALLDHALNSPPDQVDWHNLDVIARQDSAAVQRRWQGIKDAARAELRAGPRAAGAGKGFHGTCWQRAKYLDVRQELINSLGPRNAAELLLIDQMVTFQTQMWTWQQTLTMYATVASLGSKETLQQRGAPDPPRVTDYVALE